MTLPKAWGTMPASTSKRHRGQGPLVRSTKRSLYQPPRPPGPTRIWISYPLTLTQTTALTRNINCRIPMWRQANARVLVLKWSQKILIRNINMNYWVIQAKSLVQIQPQKGFNFPVRTNWDKRQWRSQIRLPSFRVRARQLSRLTVSTPLGSSKVKQIIRWLILWMKLMKKIIFKIFMDPIQKANYNLLKMTNSSRFCQS